METALTLAIDTHPYIQAYRHSLEHPEAFWAKAASAIDWVRPPTRIFDADAGVYGRWFVDGWCNACYNAVDRHVATRGAQTAILYDSPVAGEKRSISYAQLQDEVSAAGAMLQTLGVRKGDRVLIYMPMIPEAVIAMLACARIGAVHSVVFGGFAAKELAARIDDAAPRVVLSASCGIETRRIVPYKPLLDEAIRQANHVPAACVILQRPQAIAELNDGRDHDWAAMIEAIRRAGGASACEPMLATDPLYILYTSGTTGNPKGVVRDCGGYLVALQWTMRHLYGVRPGETFWCASDVGWVVGHSYIVYGPLLNGCTTVLYEGKPVGTPDAGAFWRVISDYGVAVLFTAPTALRVIRREDPEGNQRERHHLYSLRALFLAGERADPDTVQWAQRQLGVPVIDHWWQTETGWCIVGNPVVGDRLPLKAGSPTVPMPGYALHILDADGQRLGANRMGTIAIKLPLPPGNLPTLWRADARFRDAYLGTFPGYYNTADAGFIDEDGYVFVMGRTDDVINVAGHRLSTGAMEEVIASHAAVAECAVIGVRDALKGETPWGVVVLKANAAGTPDAVEQGLVALVRERIGPVATFKRVVVVPRLPKTRSGKILRSTMKRIADEEDWSIPATVEDPEVLAEIVAAFRQVRAT
ncbi:propionyl-CoA synthetase [Cupriavidus alkaliphilus]|uniref:Propionyl-CoA synthetase n=1 Tax=Cupriavidus alkaliphilus TaxID=942866 RepID=A0A7W4VEZ5_9BURK|nr:propionyl-CoA synthetase [Cupriavidus alkaliphilus]MBB3009878.1 propionyl-CoA synthetase [Cupriavidus alkaliphilus]